MLRYSCFSRMFRCTTGFSPGAPKFRAKQACWRSLKYSRKACLLACLNRKGVRCGGISGWCYKKKKAQPETARDAGNTYYRQLNVTAEVAFSNSPNLVHSFLSFPFIDYSVPFVPTSLHNVVPRLPQWNGV